MAEFLTHFGKQQLYDAVDQRRVEGGAGAEEGRHLHRHPPRLGGHEHAPDTERRRPTGMARRGSPPTKRHLIGSGFLLQLRSAQSYRIRVKISQIQPDNEAKPPQHLKPFNTSDKADPALVSFSKAISCILYIGHLKERSLKDQLVKDPTEVIRKAVLRMLPRNKLRDDRDRKLRIFVGSEHPFVDRPLESYVMPPRKMREMRPRARRALIRAQKKAEQGSTGPNHEEEK
ncbi:hypothetical protein BHE74_00052163 [Ensete ventricosum]|nr:hypothetical protein GW17_00019710 [Ensete ventricosum]RWW42300.1 hypothetical protein BHE74_00052163 [Ensete ventricosum]RZR86071.1 hypothetical protein BHM03_00013184 [Ensete ventricosum]